MLFIDDDQADVAQWSEDGGARAHDHVDIAAANALPLIVTLAVREPTVLDGHALAEGADGTAPPPAGSARFQARA
ncbi:MAG: hypothetical protein QM736_25575 [Vicinamibacterales bacterium]